MFWNLVARTALRTLRENVQVELACFEGTSRMNNRTAATWIGLAIGCLGLIGCASPYTYYCDDGGPHGLSGRFNNVGPAACDAPEMAGAGMPGPGIVGAGAVMVDEPCDSCATPGQYGRHTLTGMLHNMLTCNAGCGDIYWGEWSYDPPDDCDPCDNHGNFVGRGCCGPSGHDRFLRGLHGVRNCPVGCANGCDLCGGGRYAGEPGCGCDDCASGSAEMMDGEIYDPAFDNGMPVLDSVEPVPAPPPSIPPVTHAAARRPAAPYYQPHPNSRLVRRARR